MSGRGGGRQGFGQGRGGRSNAPGRNSGWKRCKLCGERGHTVGDCPQVTECSHCGSSEHTAKRCTFGARASERFLLCDSVEPHTPCFWRRFIVPLQRADAVAFNPADARVGRADVGLRCISSALFRSQGLRRNSQACVCFEASGHCLEVSGALARDLRPDDQALAFRVRSGAQAPDPETDPVAWSASELRGLEALARTKNKALKAALRGADGSRVVLMLLTEDGTPIKKVCMQMRQGPPLAGVVVVLGDDRGLPAEEADAMAMLAEKGGAEVQRVSLGGTTLLASHAIVILHHYLDEYVHRCKVSRPRDYGRPVTVGTEAKRSRQ